MSEWFKAATGDFSFNRPEEEVDIFVHADDGRRVYLSLSFDQIRWIELLIDKSVDKK